MDSSTARVVARYRGKYRVKTDKKEYWAEISGKMMHDAVSAADYPAVGDRVNISTLDDDLAIINGIEPRKTLIQRKAAGKDEPQIIAANIDVAFIVQAVDRDYNLNRIERYLALALSGRIKPAIVLNKADLISEEKLNQKISEVKDRFKDTDVIVVSTLDDNKFKDLADKIAGQKTYCLLGSSGVGKSSIINKLLGKNVLETKEISFSTSKGKHTTAHRELFVLENGSSIIDNPGMREVGLVESGEGIGVVFSKITGLAKECRFPDCSHLHEPGCAVLAAVEAGELDRDKYENYLKLKKESDFYSMTRLDKRRKDRSFGKMVNTGIKYKKKR